MNAALFCHVRPNMKFLLIHQDKNKNITHFPKHIKITKSRKTNVKKVSNILVNHRNTFASVTMLTLAILQHD